MDENRKAEGRGHTVEQKCRAVLSVWTERCSPGEVCRELGISWNILNQWQDRAMEGMILALQPRVPMEKGVALNPRLAVLLDRKSQERGYKGVGPAIDQTSREPGGQAGELQPRRRSDGLQGDSICGTRG